MVKHLFGFDDFGDQPRNAQSSLKIRSELQSLEFDRVF
jgi:hypothetical protein